MYSVDMFERISVFGGEALGAVDDEMLDRPPGAGQLQPERLFDCGG
jgi:hypothetical protein